MEKRGSRDVYIVGACRTAIGEFGGMYRTLRSADLAAVVLKEAVKRAGIEKRQVDEIVLGECHQQQDQTNVARVATVKAGFPDAVPGFTINKVCTSGMQAIMLGAQAIALNDYDIVLAGGVECMSAAPYVLRTARWGQKLQHGKMLDSIIEGFLCNMSGILMGMTAENLAEKYHITREEQDTIALRSQQNACRAIEEGRFREEIVPVEIKKKNGETTICDTDEYPKRGMQMADLAKLPTVFKKGGTVTAGNACGINDGAAAVVLMSGEKMEQLGIEPMARIAAYSTAGVEPELMGYGPVPATEKLLKKSGLSMDQIDLIEVNEAFAAQYIACERLLNLPREITNVNGSGISLGHPVGATGARITVTLLHELIKRGGKRGLATLCGSGGVATSLLIERV
jgi:acetyl-CoA C-acetyltransferase